VLPFLLDGDLVARVDLKADRQSNALLVQASHIEPGNEDDHVVPPLAEELRRLAGWLELSDVVVKRKGGLAGKLAEVAG
jgi:uncharacterized protein YcaQ